MRRKRPAGCPRENGSDDDANADLSADIVAKAQRLQGTSVFNPMILDTDDDDDDGRHNRSDALSENKIGEEGLTGIRDDKSASSGRKKNKAKRKKQSKRVAEATTVSQSEGPTTIDLVGESDRAAGDVLFKVIADDGEDNLEMRKLLRGPRYFDLPEEKTCFRCGNSGHVAADCREEAPKKACYVCGSFEHEARGCPQGSCFVCKGVGHFAKSCPNKGSMRERDCGGTRLCLRCGDVGHEMNGCDRNYHPEDLKVIQCYVCKQYGHLCCLDVVVSSERQVSCYNCGEIGHNGVGCAKSRNHIENEKQPARVCYKCGGEGHLARGCGWQEEGRHHDFWIDSPPVKRKGQTKNQFQGLTSVSAAVGKQSHWLSEPIRYPQTPPVPRWPEHWRMINEVNSYADVQHGRHAGLYEPFVRTPSSDIMASRRKHYGQFEAQTPSSDFKTSKRRHYHHEFHRSDGKKRRY